MPYLKGGLASIWNGAGYYFEVFSARYTLQLQEADKKLSSKLQEQGH